jgi:hypothetical protein
VKKKKSEIPLAFVRTSVTKKSGQGYTLPLTDEAGELSGFKADWATVLGSTSPASPFFVGLIDGAERTLWIQADWATVWIHSLSAPPFLALSGQPSPSDSQR